MSLETTTEETNDMLGRALAAHERNKQNLEQMQAEIDRLRADKQLSDDTLLKAQNNAIKFMHEAKAAQADAERHKQGWRACQNEMVTLQRLYNELLNERNAARQQQEATQS